MRAPVLDCEVENGRKHWTDMHLVIEVIDQCGYSRFVKTGGGHGAELAIWRVQLALFMPLMLRWKDDFIQAWLNIYPQDGRRMNWAPGLFHFENGVLRCAVQGAVFALDQGGLCTSGPCRGQALVRVPVEVEGGWVKLASPSHTSGAVASRSSTD